MIGGDGDDDLSGLDGNDTLHGGTGANVITGGEGDDTILSQGAGDVINAGPGDDLVTWRGGPATMTLGNGEDTVEIVFDGIPEPFDPVRITDFAPDEDQLNTYLDLHTASGSNVFLDSSVSEDGTDQEILLNDRVVLQLDGIELYPELDIKVFVNLSGDSDATFLGSGFGLSSDPASSAGMHVTGGSGADLLITSSGNDQILGGDGADKIYSGSGSDLPEGGDGDDSLDGGGHTDILMGGNGNDYLYGGPGEDQLYGGAGQDELGLGSGDTGEGGEGDDLFTVYFRHYSSWQAPEITDFNGAEDRLELAEVGSGAPEITAQDAGDGATEVYVNGQLAVRLVDAQNFDVTAITVKDD